MKQLRSEGFVASRPRSGTFVTDNPPHLSHYALTFPFAGEPMPSQFYGAIREEAIKCHLPGQRFSLFYDILTRHDVPDYERLVDVIRRHAVAGVIYAARPWGLWNDPVLTEPHVPRVVIAAGPHEAGVPTVSPDGAAFLPRACEWLAARKHRRVAVLGLASRESDPCAAEREVRKATARYGLETQSRWIQALAAEHADWATHLVASMLHGPTHDRPDALVITDDNLVPAAAAGVLATNRRVSDGVKRGDLSVVAHANFPHVTPSAVPARRLGFDVRRLLRVAMERLHQLRRGEVPPMSSFIPAVWEEDVNEPSIAGNA